MRLLAHLERADDHWSGLSGLQSGVKQSAQASQLCVFSCLLWNLHLQSLLCNSLPQSLVHASVKALMYRVHAKHIGHPLLGDGTYGGTGSSAITRLAGADTARCASCGAHQCVTRSSSTTSASHAQHGPSEQAGLCFVHFLSQCTVSVPRCVCCRQQQVRRLIKDLGRPALHAKTLGFEHPVTGQSLRFERDVPQDFAVALDELQTPA